MCIFLVDLCNESHIIISISLGIEGDDMKGGQNLIIIVLVLLLL